MVLTLAGHQVQTSVADLLERQWRLNNWSTKYLLGCGELCPCDICSAPTPDYSYTLNFNEAGHVTDEALDLSCVMFSNKEAMTRVITINNQVRDCELTGCEGVSVNERKKVYLTHCECSEYDSDLCAMPVKIYLQNNGAAVTHDEFGNEVPAYYLLGEGQVKYLCIVNGRITKIQN